VLAVMNTVGIDLTLKLPATGKPAERNTSGE